MSSGALFLMGVFTVTVLIDMPIAFGLVLSCLAYLAVYDSAPLMVAAQQYVVGLDSFTLLAIPLFILAAQLMNGAGLTQRIVRLCAAIVGDIKGGLAVVAVLACLMFGALSGSGRGRRGRHRQPAAAGRECSGYDKGFPALVGSAGASPPSFRPARADRTAPSPTPRWASCAMAGIIPGLVSCR